MRSIILVTGTLILAISGWLVYSNHHTATAGEGEKQPPARRAFVDPETGELVVPTAKQRRAVQQQSSEGLTTQLSQQVAEVIHRNGMTIVTVPPSAWPKESVTLDNNKESVAADEKSDD